MCIQCGEKVFDSGISHLIVRVISSGVDLSYSPFERSALSTDQATTAGGAAIVDLRPALKICFRESTGID